MEMMTIQVARADEAHADRVPIHDAVGNVDRIDGLVPYPARRRKGRDWRDSYHLLARLGTWESPNLFFLLRRRRLGSHWTKEMQRRRRGGKGEDYIYQEILFPCLFFYSRVPVLAPFLIRVLVPFTRAPCRCHGPQETGRYFWHGIYPKKN